MKPALRTPEDDLVKTSDVSLRASPLPESEPRPLSFWVELFPPGWISRHAAPTADPIALSEEIHELAVTFAHWLRLPPAARWDTFTLQVLSAALFNRFPIDHQGSSKRSPDSVVGLLELDWPPASEGIQNCVAELQTRLRPPFAVFKAVRSAAGADSYPTSRELRLAIEAIEACRERLEGLVLALGEALRHYAASRETAPQLPQHRSPAA